MSNLEKISPLVSVFVMVYNHEKYISDTLNGILMQLVDFDYEIVVGDDCSSDYSRDILLSYTKKYPKKFNLLFQEMNIGAANNQKSILSACTGKYIAFCEGDDYWIDPLKLQKQVDIFLKYPDTIICGARAKTWNENKKEFTSVTPSIGKDVTCMTPKQFFFMGSWVKTCTRMIPRALLLSVPSDYLIDYRHVHYILAKNPKGTFRCLDEVVAVYREHAGGVFSGADPLDVQKDNFESMRLIAKLYDDERAVIMRENAAHVAKELFFTRSLRIGQRLTYALQYIVLFFSNFSYLGMKRAFDRLFYRASTYLDRYPALKTHLRSFFSFVKCVGKRWG